jgi:triosephosphate isomerase (TIM)
VVLNVKFESAMPRKSKKNIERPVIITGNWKMYKTIEEAVQFVETLTPLIQGCQAQVYLAIPFTAIHPTALRVKELKSSLIIGAQNMNDASEGAFTGEIAARMLKNAGAEFVILGHSERRQKFFESNSLINKKIKRALEEKIRAILCIGETLEEREKGEMESILEKQMYESLEGISEKDLSHLILAYEPVWAIGTGKVAHPEDAESAHLFCRNLVAKKWGETASQQLVIQYGGSVKPDNAGTLLSQSNIDGLLVGGASLSAEAFSQIINFKKG